MIRYYTSRELSCRFVLNLARWKRWSREFLLPDALGGFQTGYARQYSRDDAFTVFLGGYLVGQLGFSIPEAKCVLSDLLPWLIEAGFYESSQEPLESNGDHEIVESYQVFIRPQPARKGRFDFLYTIRGVVSDIPTTYRGRSARQLLFIERRFPESSREKTGDAAKIEKVIDITDIYKKFARLLADDAPEKDALVRK